MKVSASPFKLYKNRLFSCKRFYTSQTESKKICIVGSGPAGFYTAQHILKNNSVEVDIYEKLPVPFGLIRYGVAPDHPEIKIVTNSFTKIANHERCNFFGNIDVGQDVKLSELLNAYHAVVLAFGACKDKELGIPGEDSSNVLSARKFVNWYNGHPDYVDVKVDLDVEVATVIGHGNVALDVARILLKTTDELKTTDIAQYAMDALMKSRIKKVVLVGRRGPLQVAFTIKELREMLKLKGVATAMSLKDFDGIPQLLEYSESHDSAPELQSLYDTTVPVEFFIDKARALPRSRKRLIELLYNSVIDEEKNADRTLEIKFFRSPKSIVRDDQRKVEKMVFKVNTVEGTSENAKVNQTSKEDEINCGLVFRSVGYQSMPIDPLIPFDQTKYIVPNKEGRVIGQEGLYCSGWVKTGPTGVILSTMNGSYETGEALLKDMSKEHCFFRNCSGSSTVLSLLKHRGVKFTTFNDWLQMDKVELERGKAEGKSRQKICSVKEMLQAVNIEVIKKFEDHRPK